MTLELVEVSPAHVAYELRPGEAGGPALKAGRIAWTSVADGTRVEWREGGDFPDLAARWFGWFGAIQYAGAAYLAWIGLQLLVRREGAPSPVRITPGHYLRQALLITLLNPKAIVFYMAFFPLFIDPARHQGLVTFGAMALTIALISAAYCLVLCAVADRVSAQVRAHRRLARWLERAAGACLIGFGLKLAAP